MSRIMDGITPFGPYTVSPDSPYDLDAVMAPYKGRDRIARLVFVAQSSPSLAGPAYTRALAAIKQDTLDAALYEAVYEGYAAFVTQLRDGVWAHDELAQTWWQTEAKQTVAAPDQAWVNATRIDAQRALDKLEVELKGYLTNLIKESIRMGQRDLAKEQYRVGDVQAALKSYFKSREYCTTSQHTLEMSLGVIEIALETCNYAYIKNYVLKAESALDAAASAQQKQRAPASNLPGMVAPQLGGAELAREKERVMLGERLVVANALAHLGQGQWNRAASLFTSVGRETLAHAGTYPVPQADIAMYGVLAGLATFSRKQVRARLIENSDFRAMLDAEPYLRDVVHSFQSNRFKDTLELLHKHAPRLMLDLHLSQWATALVSKIRERALLTYFSPYSSVSLASMADTFGMSEVALTSAVIELIKTDELRARIDSTRGVLVAKSQDQRALAFQRATELGESMELKTKAAVLRMKLLEADLLVKAPRDATPRTEA